MWNVTRCSEVLISGCNISAISRRAKTNQAPGWEAATRHPLTHFTRPQWAPHMTAPRSCGVSASHNFSGAFNPTRIRKVFHQHKEWTADTAPSCHDSVLKLTRIPQLFRTSLLSNLHPELMLLALRSATFGRVLRGWQESRRYFLL